MALDVRHFKSKLEPSLNHQPWPAMAQERRLIGWLIGVHRSPSVPLLAALFPSFFTGCSAAHLFIPSVEAVADPGRFQIVSLIQFLHTLIEKKRPHSTCLGQIKSFFHPKTARLNPKNGAST